MDGTSRDLFQDTITFMLKITKAFTSAEIRAWQAYIQNSNNTCFRSDKLLVIKMMNFNKSFSS